MKVDINCKINLYIIKLILGFFNINCKENFEMVRSRNIFMI